MTDGKIAACLLLLTMTVSDAVAQDAHIEQTRRIDGYRGIWFTLGQFYGPGTGQRRYAKVARNPVFPYGDKYSGGLGTYTAKHTPLAIFSELAQKTFFVYGGTTDANARHLLCMISYYDHATDRVPRPVVVHDKQGVNDPHDNPSLAIDNEGYLWVFVSGRGRLRPGFKYRSTRPLSIDGFELVSEEELTYPQPHFVPDRGCLHLFTKYTGVRELYWEYSPDGRRWTKDSKLAGIREPGHARGGHYQTSAQHGNRIGTFFNRHPDGNVDQRTDLYYVESDDMGSTWKTIGGETLSTPLTQVDNPARVLDYASEQQNVYLKDMGFDQDGHPVLLYLTSRGHEPGPPNDPRHFRVVRWDGAQWKSSAICETDHNYDMGSLYLQHDKWTVYLPSLAGPQPGQAGGELTIWQSADRGDVWRMTQQVTRDSVRNHNYARRPIQATDPFHVFWADGDPTKLSKSQLYFADSSGTRVRQLPYQMSGDQAEPERIVQRDQPFLIVRSGLTVNKVDRPPTGSAVRIKQTFRDESGPTSFRYYAPRTGQPTKTDALAYDPDPTRRDAAIKADDEASYYYRDRDLGQTFTTGDTGFKLGAITVRLQPVDVANADPGAAKVSLQLMKVNGTPRINDQGTVQGNPRWATYAFTWPRDPSDDNTPDRKPFKHFSDDFIVGETYEHLMLATGGIVPDGLQTNDYLRWELVGESQYQLEPHTTYAFLFLFDEPAEPGVKRNIPLSNRNVLPSGNASDPFPGGHMIRRDGSSTAFADVFVRSADDPEDVEAARAAATFPSTLAGRIAIQPGTLGYPDVDTYRDLYFILEMAP